ARRPPVDCHIPQFQPLAPACVAGPAGPDAGIPRPAQPVVLYPEHPPVHRSGIRDIMSGKASQHHAASTVQPCLSHDAGDTAAATSDGPNRPLPVAQRRLSQGLAGLVLGILVLITAPAGAGEIHSGAYTLRYSVINSLQIPAGVAAANGIERAGDRAIVTITLQKPTADN